ncbi:hypothetical protein PHLGIDRAFT_122647 [Phlebiopsis gigantea 11061_1 CR5-6]|uniref:Uncharacterized protein n=1 Tax=Phlebiopsis gigantea (strain 11061_1 CR5-6) TaxID=745531 RepID=A0A0C3S351_PHLG1|nr:hypothetical protein PHLGIDRAFT_122647 [Phlebiopsis gigantea 11061_1 CR5-6]
MYVVDPHEVALVVVGTEAKPTLVPARAGHSRRLAAHVCSAFQTVQGIVHTAPRSGISWPTSHTTPLCLQETIGSMLHPDPLQRTSLDEMMSRLEKEIGQSLLTATTPRPDSREPSDSQTSKDSPDATVTQTFTNEYEGHEQRVSTHVITSFAKSPVLPNLL